MLLAHKIELRPSQDQIDFLLKSMGCSRWTYNNLLSHFMQANVKWSKSSAYTYYRDVLKPFAPWLSEVSSRASRNAIDDLDRAFKNFFRRVRLGQKPGFPKFHKKGSNDSFAMRESSKFSVKKRSLRLERLKTMIPMRQLLRFSGNPKQVTISTRAGKFFASVLVDTEDYKIKAKQGKIGIDLGVKNLAVDSEGKKYPANQHLKQSLVKLAKLQKAFSKKVKGSNRRAKAKLKVQKLHYRIANQRSAYIHELTDKLTKENNFIVIEDLNVKGMVSNHCLARAISDAGFGMFRQLLEYKARLRGSQVVVIDRWFPSTKTCSSCGNIQDMPLSVRSYKCNSCSLEIDRDRNAAINILKQGEDTFKPTSKRTSESCKPSGYRSKDVDGVNKIIADSLDSDILL